MVIDGAGEEEGVMGIEASGNHHRNYRYYYYHFHIISTLAAPSQGHKLICHREHQSTATQGGNFDVTVYQMQLFD